MYHMIMSLMLFCDFVESMPVKTTKLNVLLNKYDVIFSTQLWNFLYGEFDLFNVVHYQIFGLSQTKKYQ